MNQRLPMETLNAPRRAVVVAARWTLEGRKVRIAMPGQGDLT